MRDSVSSRAGDASCICAGVATGSTKGSLSPSTARR